MGPSLSPSSVLAAAVHDQGWPCSPDGGGDDEYHEDDDFDLEFTPLLPRRQRSARVTGRPRTGRRASAATAQACTLALQAPPPPLQRSRRGSQGTSTAPARAAKARWQWRDMAFGSVRVPAAMDMGEIKRRLRARQALDLAGAATEPPSAAGWAPWRLIRSLSCKGVEAVAAAAVPVRLV